MSRRINRRFCKYCLGAIIGWLLSSYILPPENRLPGAVVAVHDGDTVTVVGDDSQQVRVRLFGIDAPEMGQPFGDAAKDALSRQVFNRKVTLIKQGQDRYGRLLATVMEGDINVNAEMVRQGYAWHYSRYSDDPILALAETQARARNAGLWQAPRNGPQAPVPPWEWRKNKSANGR